MRKLLVVSAVVAAFAAITAPVAAPQAQPNENASCIAHFMEPFGPPGQGRSTVRGPLGFPFGQEISHFASVHEGESAEECMTEQN